MATLRRVVVAAESVFRGLSDLRDRCDSAVGRSQVGQAPRVHPTVAPGGFRRPFSRAEIRTKPQIAEQRTILEIRSSEVQSTHSID